MCEISVIIPTYNRANMVCDCVDSVLAQKGVALEVIVVDDCSPDDTGLKIKERFGNDGRVRYIRNEKNKQLGGSRNVGAKLAAGKYLLFLDDDNIVQKDMVRGLVEELNEHNDTYLVAPMAINVGGTKNGRIWTLGSDFNRWTSQPKDYSANILLQDAPNGLTRFVTTYSPNAFSVRKADHEVVGGFCEDLPFYYDDSDYAWRIRSLTGGKAWILTTALTHHYSFMTDSDCLPLRELGINTTRRAYLLSRNRIRFARRHFSFLQALSVALVFAPLSAVYYGIVALKNRRADIACAYFKGTICGMFEMKSI